MRKVLDQIYEWRFYDFSYGFRKGRNYHQAIREINQKVMTKKVNFVVENFEFMVYNKVKDLSKHSKMLSFLKNRIGEVFRISLRSVTRWQIKSYVPTVKDKYTTKESKRLIRLPMYNGLKNEAINYIEEDISGFFK